MQVTTKATPPPGFEFVPIGNPALMTACKELSREKGAMIFINTKEIDPNHLSHHVHRTGHHIREAIVDEARASLEHLPDGGVQANDGIPEPLPATQEEYTTQANAAILDLFPRIPHTDRQSIIAHAFNLASINQRPKPVGLCTDITLSRRAQLAVLAHIRHTHTRYDHLLKETTWQNARKVVESLCLDILVKWRGDEETGRDQLDEILREVVVISDSDSGESDDEDEEDDTEDSSIDEVMNPGQPTGPDHPYMGSWQGRPPREQPPSGRIQPPQSLQAPLPVIPGRDDRHMAIPQPTTGRKEQRGFKRYRAWEEAIRRNRDEDDDEDDDDDPRQPPPQHMLDNAVSSGPWTSYHSPVNAVPRLAAAGPAMGGVGNVPGSNGFVQPRPYTSLAPPASPPARNPGGDNVTLYPAEHRRTLVPSGQPHYNHAPPTTMMMDGLQDMLVPSIEPASPEAAMPPSFGQPTIGRWPLNLFLILLSSRALSRQFRYPSREPPWAQVGQDRNRVNFAWRTEAVFLKESTNRSTSTQVSLYPGRDRRLSLGLHTATGHHHHHN
ncbi:Uncharacterized conserved protein (DUF2293) [Geosmithia morbida]|uniref:Uncharacterized conserved protein (DUF2293) n=1 Tax=Geosmithia morbida TaxID=1094350 RepID=A0A9P4YXW2_9HYPO|nr:Uncharacterized conserved protein (DUF2293) [Geosmithia morbida]KAF4123761.1 Uncharacterized conserved protein (DUF2293) [Geosmithia morbida]